MTDRLIAVKLLDPLRSFARPRFVPVLIAVAVTALGIAAWVDGTPVPPILALALLPLLAASVTRLTTSEDVGWVRTIVVAAFLGRCAIAAVLFVWSVAAGQGGNLTGDDSVYAAASWHVAQYLRGDPDPTFLPPNWGGEYYVHGLYVYLESILFALFGPHPLMVIVVNAALAAVTVALVVDIARGLFGRRASVLAGVIVAVYPSMLLWSVTNLRDTMVIFVITLVLWSVHRYAARPVAGWLALALLAVWLQDGLRRYILVELAAVVPVAVALTPAKLSMAQRATSTAVVTLCSAFLLTFTGGGSLLAASAPQLLTLLQTEREAMSSGRTAFVPTPTPPLTSTAIITMQAPTTVATTVPTSVPTSHPTTRPTTVPTVRPTTVPVMGPSNVPTTAPTTIPTTRPTTVPTSHPTTAPTTAPTTVPVAAVVPTAAALPSREPGLAGTLAYLPRGALYALFAPLPWELRTAADFATLPEMMLWYLILGAALATVIMRRKEWRSLLPEGLFLAGTLLLLALAEGNVGTLFRHRAMVVPSAIVLASPALAALLRPVLLRVPAPWLGRPWVAGD